MEQPQGRSYSDSVTSSYRLHECMRGYHRDPNHECRCTGGIIQRYMGKISGPLLDRIDLHIDIPAVAYHEPRGNETGADLSGSEQIQAEHIAEAVRYRSLDREYWK